MHGFQCNFGHILIDEEMLKASDEDSDDPFAGLDGYEGELDRNELVVDDVD